MEVKVIDLEPLLPGLVYESLVREYHRFERVHVNAEAVQCNSKMPPFVGAEPTRSRVAMVSGRTVFLPNERGHT